MSTQQAREADATGRGGDSTPAKVMSTVADRLTDHGLDVRSSERESHYLKITHAPGVLCDVVIGEGGSAEWEYRLSRGRYADPAVITGIVLSILGGNPARSQDALPRRYPKRTLMSVAGRALAGRGMQVCLEVFKDDFFFEVCSEIEVTNPALPSRGAVRISDDNSVRWECSFIDPAADTEGIDPLDFAETIAKVLTE
jgi:hypothetical protein